jgi:hypothetical protein
LLAALNNLAMLTLHAAFVSDTVPTTALVGCTVQHWVNVGIAGLHPHVAAAAAMLDARFVTSCRSAAQVLCGVPVSALKWLLLPCSTHVLSICYHIMMQVLCGVPVSRGQPGVQDGLR